MVDYEKFSKQKLDELIKIQDRFKFLFYDLHEINVNKLEKVYK